MEPPNKEKRIKREIANSNERRRMQSINAGFQKLKRLLPVSDGEKISKANILQHAADFITTIERDRVKLAEQNTLLRRILLDLKGEKIDLGGGRAQTGRAGKHASDIIASDLSMDIITTATTTTATTIATNTNNSSTTTNTNATRAATTTPTAATTNNNTKSAITTSTNNVPSSAYNNNDISGCNDILNMSSAAAAASNEASQNIGSVAEIISDKNASPKNGLSTPSVGAAKAAIALPLEVPYTSEIVVIKSPPPHHHQHHHHHQRPSDDFEAELMTGPRKLLKVPSGLVEAPDGGASKSQNLDTICKAIMEIEGDRLFKNEKLE